MSPLPLDHNLYGVVFWAAFAIWALPEWIGSVFQRSGGRAGKRDRGSYAILMLTHYGGMTLCFAFALWLPAAAIVWQQTLLFAAGIALVLLGVGLRWYAIRVLGEYFTRDVAVHDGQTVVQAGPYRLIRHPAYSGTLLTMLGFGLAMTNWASLIGILVCNLIGYTYRVAVEEKALCESLGQAYVEYMKRTRRFVPFLF